VTLAGFLDFTGQGWLQLAELTLAFALSALVGLEREIRQKSADLRTHTLVGVSAALFMLVSKYGFMCSQRRIKLAPARTRCRRTCPMLIPTRAGQSWKISLVREVKRFRGDTRDGKVNRHEVTLKVGFTPE
jgi:hypothetical protein